jgi:hypothetical protein
VFGVDEARVLILSDEKARLELLASDEARSGRLRRLGSGKSVSAFPARRRRTTSSRSFAGGRRAKSDAGTSCVRSALNVPMDSRPPEVGWPGGSSRRHAAFHPHESGARSARAAFAP